MKLNDAWEHAWKQELNLTLKYNIDKLNFLFPLRRAEDERLFCQSEKTH